MSPSRPPAWFERLSTVLPTIQESPFARFPGVGGSPDASARHSAVLILFGSGARGPDVLLTQRASGMRSHPGQVAFPGGRIDPEDAGPEAAALREAVEETRLDPAGVQITATGPELFLSVTNYLVTPVVAWWGTPSAVAPGDPAEVTRVVRVPLNELTDPANRFQAVHPRGFVSPGFGVADLFVWGFTAGVLNWMISLAGLERPWDLERRRPVPSPRPASGPISSPASQPARTTLVEELTEQLDEWVTE